MIFGAGNGVISRGKRGSATELTRWRMKNKMTKNAKKLIARINLMLTLLNNGMELPYLLLPLWRLNFGRPSRRELPSGSEEDLTLLRAVVLPLPLIFNGSSDNGGAAASVLISKEERMFFSEREKCLQCNVLDQLGETDGHFQTLSSIM